MITAGIDVGVETVKAIVLKDGKLAGAGMAPSGGSGRAQSVEQAWQTALKQAGLTPGDVVRVIATGQGKWDVQFAHGDVVEPMADARAARWLLPQARLVIDIGADQSRAVRLWITTAKLPSAS